MMATSQDSVAVTIAVQARNRRVHPNAILAKGVTIDCSRIVGASRPVLGDVLTVAVAHGNRGRAVRTSSGCPARAQHRPGDSGAEEFAG